SRHLMIVKANHESGNKIEFLADAWKRTKGVNPLDDASDTEQFCDFPEHGETVHVEPDSRMTEELRDVEKVPGAATQIENLLRACQIEFKLPDPPDVNFYPTVEIEVFRPVRAGIRHTISPANLFETSRINCLDHAPCLKWEAVRSYQPKGTFSRARQTLAIDEFSYFMTKLHAHTL
ncbi:MAG TPA: hypothetical protein VJR49_02430, partial [Chthoniobacterales bacterium]|nr:hypothetical protein [Chthoniobacterales bacterium]